MANMKIDWMAVLMVEMRVEKMVSLRVALLITKKMMEIRSNHINMIKILMIMTEITYRNQL
jgi:mRNA deadenylase 3'-5' endonuclease subunit Ccr4